MAKKSKTLTSEAMEWNNKTYFDYFDRLKLLATNIWEYKGLDDVFGFGASRFLENALFERGRACFVKDPEIGYLVSNANPSDKLNVYNIPTQILAWNIGYNKEFNLDDVVLLFNNTMQKPTSATIQLFAYRLFEVQRTMDVNLTAQKTPVLIEGDDKSILTLQNVYEQYSGNKPVLFGNKQYALDNKLNVLATGAPYLLDKLSEYKHELWNECLTYLGINNANVNKNQVVLTSEVDANNEHIDYNLSTFFNCRKQAIDSINEKWGLNIELSVSKEVEKMKADIMKEMGLLDKEQEVEDGVLHGNSQGFNW